MIPNFNIPRSSVATGERASGDQNPLPVFAGPRFEVVEHVAHVVMALAFVVLSMWLCSSFLDAVPAISRVVGGR